MITVGLFLIFFGTIVGTVVIINNADDIKALKLSAEKKVQGIGKDTFIGKTPTKIYDKDGNILKEYSSYQYSYLKKNEIPDNFKNAFISIEDERFKEHNGIDFKALFRAAFSLVKNQGAKTQGGSTITQQLVKNVLLTNEKTYSRKVEEIFISLYLEKIYSKDDILEYYLNNIYFGHGNYGIEAASQSYFSKSSKELNLSEIAFLTAIPNNPSLYDPYTNMANTYGRRDIILEKMFEQGYITDQQFQEANNYKIVLKTKEIKDEKPDTFLTSYATYCAIREIMKNEGFEFKTKFATNEERATYFDKYTEAYKKVNTELKEGGYDIYTSLDQQKQDILQNSLNENMEKFQAMDTETGLYKVQGAAVSVDNSTGLVVAIVGGRTQEGVNNLFNRGFLAVRQPGSAIKPLIAYTPALENGYTPNSYVEDSYIEKGPMNSERYYEGTVTLRYAVEKSINTIPYRLVEQLGVDNSLNYLHRLGFKYLTPDDKSPIVAIGGFTKGATPEEMAGAYSTLARNGDYIKTTCITKITSHGGTILYKNNQDKIKIYKSNSAYKMTDILKGVLSKPYATGYKVRLDDNRIAAGKTGTTDSSKDAWFCGYTPYYTTVVFVGADNPEPIDRLYGGTVPGSIWKQYMDTVHEGYEDKDFSSPE